MSKVTLLQGDCLKLMRDIPDGSVDMVLADLPFGVTQNSWDRVIPIPPLWSELRRVTKENAAIVLHCQQPFTAQLICSNPTDFKYCYVWYKHYCRGFLNAKKQPLRNCEDIAVFYRKQCVYNPQMVKGAFRSKGNSSKQRGCYGEYKPVKTRNDVYYPTLILDFAGVPNSELQHPTQKPVPLLEYLIKTYTNEGEMVLDPTMGSGSTGVAAANTGRRFIGIELDAGYFGIAKERIQAAREAKETEAAQIEIQNFA